MPSCLAVDTCADKCNLIVRSHSTGQYATKPIPMHFFVYEWATGGGLVDAAGPVPGSLLREGAAMIGALAGDLVRIPDCRVSALRDPRVLQLALPGCAVVDVISRSSHREEFERLAGESDATIVIAPELDDILLKTARLATASGGRLMSPSVDF